MYIVFDGGNGGIGKQVGYGSFKVFDTKGGNLLHYTHQHTFEGYMTNNEAKYHTLILALEWLHDHGDDPEFAYGPLVIEGDSDLVRLQVLGIYRVSTSAAHLLPLRDKVRALLSRYIQYTYNHIPRRTVIEYLGH